MYNRIPHLLAFAFTVTTLSVLPASAAAQSRVHGLARLGLEHGGDRVIEFQYEDGSTPDVTAGGGLLLQVGGGAQLAAFGQHGLDAQMSLGFKWRTIPAADNQDANWIRFPVEGLVFYRAPAGFRVGAGATVHMGNVLKASGSVLNDRVEFQNTPGFVLQADYTRRNMVFDLRYTALDYEAESSGETVDASSIGIGLSFLFGQSRPAATGGSARR